MVVSKGVEIAGVLITLPTWAPYVAVAVSGLAGAVDAAKRGFDVIGILSIAIVSGVGGLLLRDIVLQDGTPVVLTKPGFLATAGAVAVFGFFFAGLISRVNGALVVLEGLAIGFLCTVGATPALKLGLGYSSAVLTGVVTAVGGIVLRDILSGTAPRIVRPGSFVAIAALASTSVFVALLAIKTNIVLAQFIAMAVALGLRIGAHWLGWGTRPANELADSVWGFWYRGKRKVTDLTVKPGDKSFSDSDQRSS